LKLHNLPQESTRRPPPPLAFLSQCATDFMLSLQLFKPSVPLKWPPVALFRRFQPGTAVPPLFPHYPRTFFFSLVRVVLHRSALRTIVGHLFPGLFPFFSPSSCKTTVSYFFGCCCMIRFATNVLYCWTVFFPFEALTIPFNWNRSWSLLRLTPTNPKRWPFPSRVSRPPNSLNPCNPFLFVSLPPQFGL